MFNNTKFSQPIFCFFARGVTTIGANEWTDLFFIHFGPMKTLFKHMHAKRHMQKSDAMIIGQKLAQLYTHKHQIFRLFKGGVDQC